MAEPRTQFFRDVSINIAHLGQVRYHYLENLVPHLALREVVPDLYAK